MRKFKNKEQTIENLNALIQLDFDAALTYERAIRNIGIPRVRVRLSAFRKDHQRHIADLSSAVRKLGGLPPELNRDLKGFLLESFTRFRSMTGTAGALRAMRGNEVLTNVYYDRALAWSLPEEIRSLVVKNRDDEIRHLAYIEMLIREKIWEEETKAEAA